MKSGFVSIIGRPNVGKSTLLNSILQDHIAITSPVSQTTRNIIQGVYNEDDTQIVFIDTPGIHKPINKLGKVLNKEAVALTHDIDAILFVVDAASGIGTGDKFIIDTFKNNTTPVILILNKIDCMSKEAILKAILDYKDLYSFSEIVPISALKDDNVDHLIEVIKKYLTDNVKYFDTETKTSLSKYFMISEFVREKLMNRLEEEIPHSITCVTTHYEDDGKMIDVGVDIIVDRDSLKKIVIGKDGALLKAVGTEARADIEKLLGKKVFLELYVKTIDNWRDKDKYLHELGFMENE